MSWSWHHGGAGSSPRGRGTRSHHQQDISRRRFIPAWAGNTALERAARIAATVHPRVGGEHSCCFMAISACAGSSPRGRGTLHALVKDRCFPRFIPAWAGNTTPPAKGQPQSAVHPRVGGEHAVFQAKLASYRGSSPRGRGTHWPKDRRDAFDAVHPRVGGEHSIENIRIPVKRGSSPRGRGTLRMRTVMVCYQRREFQRI